MKHNPKRVWRSVIAVVLTLTMVLSMAATAFATNCKDVELEDYTTKGDISVKVQELYDLAKVYYGENEAEIADLLAEFDVEITEDQVAQLDAAVETFLADFADGKYDAEVDAIEAEINALNEELFELKAYLESEEVQAELKATAEAQIAVIEEQIEILEAKLAQIERALDELYTASEQAKAAVENMIEIVKTGEGDMKAEIEALKEAINQVGTTINEVKFATDAVVDAIDEAVAVAEAINEAVEELNETLMGICDAIDTAILETVEAIEATVKAINDAVVDFNTAVEEVLAAFEAAVEEAIAWVEARIEAATHCDYEINKDNYYVALGDSTVLGKGNYAKKLAAELGVEYKNLSKAGMTAADMIAAIEENADDIEKADLITLGLGNAEIMSYALAEMMEPTEKDWAAYVGEYDVYVEEALAEVAAYIAENVGDEEVAALLTDAVEAYAYGYTVLACNYPEAVNAIKAINEDAQIIIVGMYNPLADVVVEFDGAEIAVGEYIDYVIAASNAHYFGFSLISGDAIYVDAPAVDNGAAGTYAITDFLALISDATELAPAKDGHEYIKEQILNAMNITVAEEGLLGDVDGNGEVDFEDASLILEYYVGNVDASALNLAVGDVDGSGEVDFEDASLILEYYVGNIEVFPAA